MVNLHVLRRIQHALKAHGTYSVCKGNNSIVLVNTSASHNAFTVCQAIIREFSSDDSYIVQNVDASNNKQCAMLSIESSDERTFELLGVSICTNMLDKVQTVTLYW